MEVLEVSGYVSEEKAVIASRYLGPQAKDASGLAEADVQLEPTAVDILIKYYCRESVVRNLKKHIEKVCVEVECECKLGLLNFIFLLDRFIARLRLNSFRILEKMLSQNPQHNLLLLMMLARGQQLTRRRLKKKAPHQQQQQQCHHHHHHQNSLSSNHHHQNQRQRPTKRLWNHHQNLRQRQRGNR
jgi:hypothetical protein